MFTIHRSESILSYQSYKKNIKKNLLEAYVNFVDTTKKQNTHSKLNLVLFVLIVSLFFFFSLNT